MASEEQRPLGPVVVREHNAWTPGQQHTTLKGQYATVTVMTSEHAIALYPHISGDENAHLWDYMLGGPFNDPSAFCAIMEKQIVSPDVVLYAIIPTSKPTKANGKPNVIGCASYMNINNNNRTIEVGSVMFSLELQKTPVATEAMYLMAKEVLSGWLGYRRYEWKCNSLNAASRRAALRLGFTFEGIFRNHMVIKGRSRDTAWFAMTDNDWPGIEKGFQRWLDPSNFDDDGQQREKLEDCRDRESKSESEDENVLGGEKDEL
ncbi:acyl-CoA N-acyltransferase [Astrocystis sublimbata]|nr:acyl-CoA N-acyltransferase [Astrocystis sublimbata]